MTKPRPEPEVEAAQDRAEVKRLIADGCPENLAAEMVRDTRRAVHVGRLWQQVFETITGRGKSQTRRFPNGDTDAVK